MTKLLNSPEVEQLCWHATRPGREGVAAMCFILNKVPRTFYGEAMKLVWRNPPGNRMAWACLFAVAWRTAGARVAEAAG